MTEDERYAIWQRAQQLLEETAGIKEQLQARRAASAERGEGGWVAPQQPEPRSARQRAAKAPARDWEREKLWVEAIVNQRIAAIPEAVGIALGKERVQTREAAAASETAITALLLEQERHLAALEARIAALEATETRAALPNKPRLIGGSDAA